MIRRFALIVATALMIEAAGAPVTAYAAAATEVAELTEVTEVTEVKEAAEEIADEEVLLADEISEQQEEADPEYDEGESEEILEPEEPEEPQFVSPVEINKDADIKLGETWSRIKIAAGSTGTVDVSTDEDSSLADMIPLFTERKITSSDESIVSVSESGGIFTYTATGHGNVELIVTYKLYQDDAEYTSSFNCYVTPDMTEVVADSSKFVNRYDASSYLKNDGYTVAKFTFSGLPEGAEPFSKENSFFSYKKKKGSKLKLTGVELYDNTLKIRSSGSGKAVVDVTLNGRAFTFTVVVRGVKLTKSTALVVRGRKIVLRAKNLPGDVVWTSDNNKIATVKGGVVKTKKEGSALITAKSGDFKLYAVVNVVSKKKMSAIRKGKKIVKGTYSQAKRMRSGYYDCSSLVWRICRSSKITNFGIKWYAPVAAGEAKYLVTRGKKVGEINNKNIQKRKFNPGDLYFATGKNNHRYKGIYHVEMFTGYDISGLTSKGKPVYTCTWLNRVTGYPYFGGVLQKGFLARP